MIVKIKRKHIRKGIPGSHSSCPIALAIKENLTALSKHTEPIVVVTDVWMKISRSKEIDYMVIYHGPDVTKIIHNFDKTNQMAPFDLTIGE